MNIKYLDSISYNPVSQRLEGCSNEDLENIRTWIKEPEIVVLKDVFERELLDEIRKGVFAFFQGTPSSNPKVKLGMENYHRISNNPEKSMVKKVNHVLTSFYWNDGVAGELPLLKAMSIFRNQVAGLPVSFALNEIEDAYGSEWITAPKVVQYPRGGGHLNKHQDPENIQYTTILSLMTDKGLDYSEGGFYFELNGQKIILDDMISAGDVYMASPSVVHGVESIDGGLDASIDWNDAGGRWVLFPTLVELKSLAGQKVEGLKDLQAV